MTPDQAPIELVILGGAGHVGLPLAVAFANQGIRTCIVDINQEALHHIRQGQFPFREEGGDEALQQALAQGNLLIADHPRVISQASFILTVIGTPVDEHLSPDMSGIHRIIEEALPYFQDGQTLILRSTVFPGTSEYLQQFLHEKGRAVQIAFCPERIVEGKALTELRTLPQIVATFDEETFQKTAALFQKLTTRAIVRLSPTEAELGKLLCNAWRYIKFSVGNQFYMLAESKGINYHRVFEAINTDYPRNQDLPVPGFAAGPCLLKDTMQLASFTNNTFFLGHAAMLVNEGMPAFVLTELKKQYSLREKTIGILGMAFKPEVDDPRESLSYKLRKLATIEAKKVLCHDPFIHDPSFVPLERILSESDIVIIATPHQAYHHITPQQYPHLQMINLRGTYPSAPTAQQILVTGAHTELGQRLTQELFAQTPHHLILMSTATQQIPPQRTTVLQTDPTAPNAFAACTTPIHHIYHLVDADAGFPQQMHGLFQLCEWARTLPNAPHISVVLPPTAPHAALEQTARYYTETFQLPVMLLQTGPLCEPRMRTAQDAAKTLRMLLSSV